MTAAKRSLAMVLEGLVDLDPNAWPEITGLALDSRQLRPGDAFIALRGAAGHGLDFAAEARQRGAVAVVHDGLGRLPDGFDLPVVAVTELAAQLPVLAARMWGETVSGMDLVAVTGTNGKSSVAWLLAQALDGAMIGTLGWGPLDQLRPISHTTPDLFSIWRMLAELRAAGCERVVLEVSSHALDQGRVAGLAFSSTIFTCLGHDHLDYHASLEAYGSAKARLFTDYPSRRCLLNLDDPFGAELADRLADQLADGCRLIGYSIAGHPQASVVARQPVIGVDGIETGLELDGTQLRIHSRLLGSVNVWNLLVVAAELHARGHSLEAIRSAIAALEPVPGRMEPVRAESRPLALIDYAHTPDALDRALLSARELGHGLLWCVFGCGGDRDREKRPLMGRIAERLADHVILTDDNPRHENSLAIIRDIQSGMRHPLASLVIQDRGRAIAHALESAAAVDVVLIAGKGHEQEQIVGDQRLPCDDRQSAREALGVAA